MPDQPSTLRAMRRAETQRTIQVSAIRLFAERGYDATPVSEVANAAGVSPMTVYRHFPTKEDLVLVDQNAELVAGWVSASDPGRPLVRRISGALIDAVTTLTAGEHRDELLLPRLRLMISTPALRARHLDNTYALQLAIVDALGEDLDADTSFRAHSAASACLAAMHTALVRWAEDDGRSALPELIAQAFAAAFGDEVLEGSGG